MSDTSLPPIDRVIPIEVGEMPTSYPQSFFTRIEIRSRVSDEGAKTSVRVRDVPYNYSANTAMPGERGEWVSITEDLMALAAEYPVTVGAAVHGFMGVLLALHKRAQLEAALAQMPEPEAGEEPSPERQALLDGLAAVEAFLQGGAE